MAGYHTREIARGELGKVSKVREELEDALEQGNRILALCEMADLYGALEHMAQATGTSMEELRVMAHATQRAFRDGSR